MLAPRKQRRLVLGAATWLEPEWGDGSVLVESRLSVRETAVAPTLTATHAHDRYHARFFCQSFIDAAVVYGSRV